MLLFVLLDTWLILGLNEKHIQWEALLEKLGESRWEENDKSFHVVYLASWHGSSHKKGKHLEHSMGNECISIYFMIFLFAWMPLWLTSILQWP